MSGALEHGAHASNSSSIVTFAGVCSASARIRNKAANLVRLTAHNSIPRGILVRSVSKCNVAFPRGSSRNCETASASQTTVRATQSKRDLETPPTRQTSVFRTKRFFPRERVASRCYRTCRLCSLRPATGQRSVPMSRNRDVLGSLSRMRRQKMGEAVSKGLPQAWNLATLR